MKIKTFYNENKDKKLINEINVEFDHEFANEIVKSAQISKIRTITNKQLNPIDMSRILELYSKNISITQIADNLGFSRKTIRNNLNKSVVKELESKTIKKRLYNITFIKMIKTYSLRKWIDNWMNNSLNKKIVWESISNNRFKMFINWWNENKKNKKIFEFKPSADMIIYKYSKSIKNNRFPIKKTIYNWCLANKFNFKRFDMIKLSKGFYYIKKTKIIKRRNYYDNSKPIEMLKEDMIGKIWNNVYEIDLVKGKTGDKFSILTCLNKVSKKIICKNC